MRWGQDVRFFSAEKPEGTTYLQQRMEGRQVARLTYVETANAEQGVAFELTSGARLILWAQRDLDARRYSHRVVFRYMGPVTIWTKSRALHFGRGRDRAAEEPPDTLQQHVEGEVIVGCAPTYEPGVGGGEVVVFEFRGGAKLRLTACAPGPQGRGLGIRATLEHEFIKPPEKTVMGGPLIVIPGR